MIVGTSLTAGGNVTMTSVGNVQVERVQSLAGDISVTTGAAGQVTGVGSGTRGTLVANGEQGDILVNAGSVVRMSTMVANQSVNVTADAIDIINAQARNGPLNLFADVGDLTITNGSTRASANLRAARDVNVLRRLVAGGNVDITAGRDANTESAEVTSANGTVTIRENTPPTP